MGSSGMTYSLGIAYRSLPSCQWTKFVYEKQPPGVATGRKFLKSLFVDVSFGNSQSSAR